MSRSIKPFAVKPLAFAIVLVAVMSLLFSAGLPKAHGLTVIALDAAANASCDDSCGVTLSWSHTVGSGASNPILIVGVSAGGQDKIVSTVTYGGTALTLIRGQTDPNNNIRAEMWYLLNPPPGTATVQVTFSGSQILAAVGGSVSYYKVAGIGSSNSASGTTIAGSNLASVTVDANSGDLVVDTLVLSYAPASPDASQKQRWNVVTAGSHALVGAGSDKPASSPIAMTWTLVQTAGHTWAIIAADLQPVAPIPEYPLGLPLLAIFMVIGYGLIRRRTALPKN